jgi:hypothetical protein
MFSPTHPSPVRKTVSDETECLRLRASRSGSRLRNRGGSQDDDEHDAKRR